jgi:hypothetical protein
VFFGAQLISSAGGAVAPIALAFAILQIGGRGSGIAVVLGCEFVVYTVLLPVTGVIADRTAGVGVLVTSQAIAATFQMVEATLIISGAARVWSLAVVAAGGAGGAALFTPTGRRVLPRLVPAGQLNRANALSQVVRRGIAMIGPVAGGALVATAGPGWGIAWDSVTFVIAGVLFSRLSRPPAPPEHHRQRWDRTWAGELTGGVRAFTSRTWLWTTTLADCLAGGAFSAAMLIGPLYARQHLHGAISWGTITGSLAARTALGSIKGRWCSHVLCALQGAPREVPGRPARQRRCLRPHHLGLHQVRMGLPPHNGTPRPHPDQRTRPTRRRADYHLPPCRQPGAHTDGCLAHRTPAQLHRGEFTTWTEIHHVLTSPYQGLNGYHYSWTRARSRP